LINSYLGNNSTISCCEVLNSLIFPSHEQHHNNSFLCAALVMGQSNIAAGATIGSNHNSRAGDGEMIAARGFWPGLCVSLKHNSKFSTFTLIAKGDYPAELNIQLPFSLISNEVSENKLIIMPAYWFMYNLYALARNTAKYVDRDNRTKKIQHIEYDYLAPDSVNEIFTGLRLLQKFTAQAFNRELRDEELLISEGERILLDETIDLKKVEVYAEDFECTNRRTQIVKVREAYRIYRELVVYYSVQQFLAFIKLHSIEQFDDLAQSLPAIVNRKEWLNIGGQLLPKEAVEKLINDIKHGEIKTWNEIHHFYQQYGKQYAELKFHHAYASLLELLNSERKEFTASLFSSLLQQALKTKTWMTENIHTSRAKDYQNAFRKMIYDNDTEMEKVIGKLDDNVFINQQQEELEGFRKQVNDITQRFLTKSAVSQ
ncbi:MAG TPA: DUF4954 family protein, partial [Flavisolibacter sp.]